MKRNIIIFLAIILILFIPLGWGQSISGPLGYLPFPHDNYVMSPKGIYTPLGFELWTCSGHGVWPPDLYSGEHITFYFKNKPHNVIEGGALKVYNTCIHRADINEVCLQDSIVDPYDHSYRIVASTVTYFTSRFSCGETTTNASVLVNRIWIWGDHPTRTYLTSIAQEDPDGDWGVGHPTMAYDGDSVLLWVWDQSIKTVNLWRIEGWHTSWVGGTNLHGILEDVINQGPFYTGLLRVAAHHFRKITSADGLIWHTVEDYLDNPFWSQLTSPSWVETETGEMAQPETILGWAGEQVENFRLLRYSPGAIASWLPDMLKGTYAPRVDLKRAVTTPSKTRPAR